MYIAIFFEYIVDDLIPVFPGEVDVKIRRRAAVRIKKSFEIKIQFYGINVCDLQAICDNRVSATAPAYIEETPFLRIAGSLRE